MDAFEIHLKGGGLAVADTESITVRKTPDGISSFAWNTPEGAKRKLMYVDIDEIAAVVYVKGE